MKKKQLHYTKGEATEEDLLNHLLACNVNFVPPLSDRISLSDYAKKIKVHSVTFEAWSEDKLAGLIAAYFNDPSGRTSFITNVSVITEFMGSGVASELLKRCVDHALENGFTEISLEVNRENFAAINFYSKFSFSKDGIKNDCLIMKRKV